MRSALEGGIPIPRCPMSDLPLFLAALVVAFLVPGPDMILMIQTGAARGRGPVLAAAGGLATARVAHVALSSLGLSALFATSPAAYDVVRYAGAAYLAFLGIKVLRSPGLGLPDGAAAVATVGGAAAAFRQGVFTSVLNPKAYLFASVLLPQFVRPEAGAVGLQFAALGAILVVCGAGFDLAFGFAGTGLGRLVRGNRLVERVQRWVFGAVLIGFGARLAAA